MLLPDRPNLHIKVWHPSAPPLFAVTYHTVVRVQALQFSDLVWIPALPFTSCVMLGNLLNLSAPQILTMETSLFTGW